MTASAYNLCIQLGKLTMNTPVILAPMSGVTDRVFRTLARACGTQWVVSEMIASRQMIDAEKTRPRFQKRQTTDWDEEPSIIVQIAGCEPLVMAEAAKLCVDRGAAVIDINFGCPAKKITHGQVGGAALMRDERQAARILEAVVKAVDVPVTLKMRTGWDLNNRNAPSLAKIAEASGIQMITVHGRTREQFYTGHADWSFIKNIKKTVQIPVIANGDIQSEESVTACLAASGADGLMVGRAAVRQPWLIGRLVHYLETGTRAAPPSYERQAEIHITHYQDILTTYGLDRGIKMARKHLAWAVARLPQANLFQTQLTCATTPDTVITLLREAFAQTADLQKAA
ncbi:MAG: tRNA dihydrouridine synthase DusB [Alphaproteobacteria bacterium]